MEKITLWFKKIINTLTPPDRLETYFHEDNKRKMQYVYSWHRLIQEITSGKTANSKYTMLRETLLTTYTLNEEANFEELMTDFINHHIIASYNLVMEHVPGALAYNVNTDYLYDEPEIILFFERARNNPQAVLEAFRDTHFEEAVRNIVNAVQIGSKRFNYNAQKSKKFQEQEV